MSTPASGKLRHEPLHREDEGGRAGDVIEEDEARPGGDGLKDYPDHLTLLHDRERDRRHRDTGTGAERGELEHLPAGAVGVVRRQELVARLEPERPHDGVDARRGVGDEGQVVRVGADEDAKLVPGRVEAGGKASPEEVDRLALQLPAERRLDLEDGDRAGPERAMVQVGHGRVERPEVCPAPVRHVRASSAAA